MADSDELDVFTNTTLVLVVVFAIAWGISDYSDALVERALRGCEIAPASLQECMRAEGYVPIKPDPFDERAGWQSDLLRRLLGDVNAATAGEGDSWQ